MKMVYKFLKYFQCRSQATIKLHHCFITWASTLKQEQDQADLSTVNIQFCISFKNCH